eukprot:SAG31_NODE_44522_length_262_cov_0.950920_2_plen_26_part_01
MRWHNLFAVRKAAAHRLVCLSGLYRV